MADYHYIMDIEFEDGDYSTLSGYLVEKLGKIPTKKDEKKEIETENAIYKIEKVEDKHIAKVKACKIEQKEE